MHTKGCTEVPKDTPAGAFDADLDFDAYPRRNFWDRQDCEAVCCLTSTGSYEKRGSGCDLNCNTTEEICAHDWCLTSRLHTEEGQLSKTWFCQNCPDPFREAQMLSPYPTVTTTYDCLCFEDRKNSCGCYDMDYGNGSNCMGAWCNDPSGEAPCLCTEGSLEEHGNIFIPSSFNRGKNCDAPIISSYQPTKIMSGINNPNSLQCSCFFDVDLPNGSSSPECYKCAPNGGCIEDPVAIEDLKCKCVYKYVRVYSCESNEWTEESDYGPALIAGIAVDPNGQTIEGKYRQIGGDLDDYIENIDQWELLESLEEPLYRAYVMHSIKDLVDGSCPEIAPPANPEPDCPKKIVTSAVIIGPGAELWSPPTRHSIKANIAYILKVETGGADFEEIEIELVKSNPNDCCSEAMLNPDPKKTIHQGYTSVEVDVEYIPIDAESCGSP